MAARDIAATVLESINVEDLQLMDIATVASFTGMPVERAAKAMPIIELGQRSRRVRMSDYKAYLTKNTKTAPQVGSAPGGSPV